MKKILTKLNGKTIKRIEIGEYGSRIHIYFKNAPTVEIFPIIDSIHNESWSAVYYRWKED